MKVSFYNLQTIFTLSVLIVALSSCEKDDKLESPEEVIAAELHSEEFALRNDSAGLTLNYLESEPLNGMYINKVYSSVKPQAVYQYGSDASDIVEFFTAYGNNVPNRPLVLLAPGGGWQSYTEVPKLREFAKDLALRGYAVGLIQYYIKTGTPDFDVQLKAIQDYRSAIRYFKLHASNLNIDPDNVFIGGWSTGAVSALAAGYIEDAVEILEISDIPFRDAFLQSINNLGFDNNDNPGPDSKVRGVLGMFTWSLQKTFIDAGEPALMMINHKDAHFTDGTNVIGKISYNGGTVYGTDSLHGHATTQGFVDGQNLEYIRMNGYPYPYKGSNESCLWDGHYNAIARFFARNMKK